MTTTLRSNCLLVCAACALASPARADEANTNLLHTPPPATGYFGVDDPGSIGRGALHVGATLDGGNRILVVRDPATGMTAVDGAVIDRRVAMHVAAGFGVHERLELGVALSTAVQRGDGSQLRAAVPTTALGDLRLRGKLAVVRGARFSIAGALEVSLPTSSDAALFGDRTATLTPTVIGGARLGRGELAAQLGYRWRGPTRYGDLVVDDELIGGVAARYPIAAAIWAQAELAAALGVQARGDELERPVEAITGLRARIAGSWIGQIGVGLGLSRGYGTAEARGLVMLGYVPMPPRLREAVAWAPSEAAADELPDVTELPAAPRPATVQVIGDRIVLPASVLFDLNAAEVKPAGLAALEDVVQLWLEHPEWERMAIEGHTDVRGDAALNQRLSEQRATQVRDALIRLGISAERVEAIGRGASSPVTTGATEDDHARNRRVELVITLRRVSP